MQFTICSLQYAVYNMQFTICSLQYAVHNMQFTICSSQYAVYSNVKESYLSTKLVHLTDIIIKWMKNAGTNLSPTI